VVDKVERGRGTESKCRRLDGNARKCGREGATVQGNAGRENCGKNGIQSVCYTVGVGLGEGDAMTATIDTKKGVQLESQAPGWLAGIAGAVLAAFTGAVAWVFKTLESKNRQLIEGVEKRLTETERRSVKLEADLTEQRQEYHAKVAVFDERNEECRRDREQLRIELAVVEERVRKIEPNANG